jgi:hypothetical protein
MLYDDEPHRLIVNDLKRDFSGRDSDAFGLVLDTFQDRRNAYGFLTNPGGAQRETQAYDNGRRNDANWNGVWFVRTAVRPDGWSLEIAIPFKTLRFPDRPAQRWGLNLVRFARRQNEVSTWAPVPRQFSHYHVGYAGTLEGLEGVGRGRDLRVTPFVTARVDHGAGKAPGWSGATDGGLDLKYGLTSSLAVDATWRTDFSQVEADEQQINLTRFSLFFPEKRQFFLESPASFQIGLVEPESEDPRRDLVPFFSRRIGLVDGQPVPVVGGLRLTGRAGRQGVGVLAMRTAAGRAAAGDNFAAFRVTRDLAASASIGAFYFGRESAGAGGFNRVGGLDFRLAPRPTLEIEALAMGSRTSFARSDWAGRTGFRIDGNAHRARVGFLHVGEAFRHDLGFVRRRGVATLFGRYARILRPADASGRIREYSAGVVVEATADAGYRRLLTRSGSATFGLLLADGGELRAVLTTTAERLETPFGIGSRLTVPSGDYRFEDVRVEFQSNRSAAVSMSVETVVGEFWHGAQRGATGSLRVRVNAHLAASATFGRSTVRLPGGAFTGDLAGVRLDWSLTPRVFLNAFVQYNGETETWLSNVRFNVIHRPLSDIYVVWNETRGPDTARRAVLVKYTQLLAF